LWECTGGAVVAGEDSITGAIRELQEELGIEAEKDELQLINTNRHPEFFVDTYVLRKNIDLEALRFQEDEVTDAKLVTFDELINMQENESTCGWNQAFEHLYRYFKDVREGM
jgi:8-oxo-dGTP pyrophosphatase MutT (NUDIX family)